MKDLPKMYAGNINKDIRNNRTLYSTLNGDKEETKETNFDRFSIEQKIFDIFNAKDYIYKADVIIVTDSGKYNKRIVGKNSNNLITMDNEYIPISIIRDIYKS